MPIPQQRPQPILLDRLTESGLHDAYDNRALKQSILRDLSWLLGTIALSANPTVALDDPDVQASVLNYGIPDLLYTLQNPNHIHRAEQALALAIKRFEPRIVPDSLCVRIGSANLSSLSSEKQSHDIHVSGLLWSEPRHLEFSLVKPITLMDSTR